MGEYLVVIEVQYGRIKSYHLLYIERNILSAALLALIV